MVTNMNFGECLNLLLSTLDISMNRLSKAINIDSSLVSRWVNGKRIPGYNTIYIESITEYLSKNIKNSFQEQRINEIFLNINENDELDGDLKEKIKKVLLESQGYSIECKKKDQKEKKNQSTNEEQISSFLNMNQPCYKKQDNINDENLIWNTDNLIHTTSLSSEDKIIFGIENILSAGISLLETAANQKCKDNKIIYITYNNESMANNNYYKLVHWRNILLKAINNGWKVLFLLRLDNNINRIIKFINFAYPLIITGGLRLYYFNKYDISAATRETYVVSGVGLLSCFPTEPNSEINCSFYLKSKSGVDVFKSYFNVLLTNHAQPLVKYYSKDMDMEYYSRLTEIEDSIGNRFQYKYCFSMFTLTENLLEKILKRKKTSNNEILIELNLYKIQLKAFLTNIQKYEYNDIYIEDAIKDLVKYRKFHFHSITGIGIIDLEVQDIIEILQNMVNLLEAYDNFNIAFMPQNTSSDLRNVDFYCVVKERNSVLFETFNSSKSISKVRLSIEEPMMIKAFHEYFKQTWEQIAPVNKDKREIILVLQNEINILKNNY